MGKNPFASGLGPRGKTASWAIALALVGGFALFETNKNKIGSFGTLDQTDWNAAVLAKQQQQGNKK